MKRAAQHRQLRFVLSCCFVATVQIQMTKMRSNQQKIHLMQNIGGSKGRQKNFEN